ncbi:MAG: type II secretion system minor pseudopilin GspJ [Oceanospirillaceae bacterium]|nr:type II secretion system minor pseudopilin GspJ [Oceanospirillaceae bacterium]
MNNIPVLKHKGFTLLEVLIALSLFAVLSAMAFGGLNQLLGQHQQLQTKQQRFVDLQSTILVLERDFSQIVPRSIRDSFGDPQAALKGNSTPEFIYELTSKTWFNPHHEAGVLLQRVSYQLQDQKLWRSYYTQLDAGIASNPVRYPLLDRVTDFKVRFLPDQPPWLNFWPPVNQQGKGIQTRLPRAIELQIKTLDLGTITRILEIPQFGGSL